MSRNGGSRIREGPGSVGIGSPTTPEDIAPSRGAAVAFMLTQLNTAVVAKLVRLHHRGYVTRRELERECGLPYETLTAIAAGEMAA